MNLQEISSAEKILKKKVNKERDGEGKNNLNTWHSKKQQCAWSHSIILASAVAEHTKILGINIGSVVVSQALLSEWVSEERKTLVSKLPPLSFSFFWRRWIHVSSEDSVIAVQN